jgi:tetratricopeptide (TPR) repeat protein
LQAKLADSEHKDKFRQAFAGAFVEIAQKIPQSPTREFIESVKDVVPHLEEVAQNLTDVLRDDHLLVLFAGLGRFYEGQGLYTLAIPWFKQCLELSQGRLGEDPPNVATSLNDLAYLYHCQGRYDQAEPLYCQALELTRCLLGEEHPDVATILNNLAYLYHCQGRYDQAEPLYHQALELRRCLLGENHPDVAHSLNNLALLYYSQGRYNKAEPLLRQALDMNSRLLGETHLLVASTLNNLALLYESQGRYDQAEPLYHRALELRRHLLGGSRHFALIGGKSDRTFRRSPLISIFLMSHKKTIFLHIPPFPALCISHIFLNKL